MRPFYKLFNGGPGSGRRPGSASGWVKRTTPTSGLFQDHYVDGNYVGNVTHDSDQVKQWAENLRGAGVRAKASDTSSYVGHHVLMVHKDDLPKLVAHHDDNVSPWAKSYHQDLRNIYYRRR